MEARILVVDDEAANRALVRRLLTSEGYDVEEAVDGNEAAAAIERRLPDLVLLDVEMPGLDGYGVLRLLKGNPVTRLVPVVMLTGHHQLPDRLRAVEIGADDYIHKPFDLTVLSARVKSLLSLKRFTDELENASLVLEGIANCVESRDRYTGNHCKRLSRYADQVGAALGLGDEDRRILRLGGVLHDLGKIAISDVILNKRGPLTPEEFALMKSHAAVGADLCGGMKTLEKVLPLIRHHHEKLDGSGYPDGIGGKEIPLLVRITSVVDVFDALHTRRSYKESFPLGRCFEILREECHRGWWDRDVVETLVRVVTAPEFAPE